MRWQYLDMSNPDEAAYYTKVIHAIDCWWEAFVAKKDDLDANIEAHFEKKPDWDLSEWMHGTLQSIDEALMWEFGPAVSRPGRRLVITAESEYRLSPIIRTILDRAPQIDGWEFYSHRLPEDLEMAKVLVEARCREKTIDFSCEVKPGRINLVDLIFEAPDIEIGDERALSQAFVFAETLLGEVTLNRWIGNIEVRPSPSLFGRFTGGRTPTIPLGDLRCEVEKVISRIVEGLSPATWNEKFEKAEWKLLERKPKEAPDYPEQMDIFVARTPDDDLWLATRRFFLRRAFQSMRRSFLLCQI